MNTLFKHPVYWLVGACTIAGLALASISNFSSSSIFSHYQRPEQGTSANTSAESQFPQTELSSADDCAKISLGLAAFQTQLKDLKVEHGRLADRFRDVYLKLSALRDIRRADDDVSSPSSDLSPEAVHESEQSRIEGFENMLVNEPADTAGSSDLRERIEDLLAQRESQAQLLDVRCGMSLCGITLAVSPENLASDEMLVDSIIAGVNGSGTMLLDEERGQLVLYVGRNGQSLPRLEPERS